MSTPESGMPVESPRPTAAFYAVEPRRRALRRATARALARVLPQVRYRLARVGPAGLTGLGVIAAAAVAALALLVPAHRSVLELRGELNKAGHVVPQPGDSQAGPGRFAATLPTRAQIPGVLGVVLVQATDAGIALDQGKYTFSAATPNRLARYTFEFPVKAEYGKIRTFIDKTLAAVPALGLDKLHVERRNVADPAVNADVGFVIYVRGA